MAKRLLVLCAVLICAGCTQSGTPQKPDTPWPVPGDGSAGDARQIDPDDQDGDGFTRSGGKDCNDEDATIHPGAVDLPYDGIDQDCDGEDLTDVDKDGFDSTQVPGGTDCNDNNYYVNPAGVEKCGDGVDQDCSGEDLSCSNVDKDGDGYTPLEGDCNDDDKTIHPGATEVPYNDKDDDCDLSTPNDDLDGDGFFKNGGKDCDDSDKTIYPGAAEVPYDGIDQDCNGVDLTDVDKDGYDSTQVAGGTDCDDGNPFANPAGVEKCGDGVDQDCSGADLACSDVDEDGDNYTPNEGDCDDTDKAVHPGATEVPYNGKDDDCSVSTPDDDLDGDGFYKNGGKDCDDSDKTIFPGASETPYDGIDQDCSGADLTDVDGDGYDSPQVTGGTDCDDDDKTVYPGAFETPYNSKDENCDGSDLVTEGAFEIAPKGNITEWPRLAFNGTNYLVVWRQYLSGYRIRGQLLSPAGLKVGAAFDISTPPPIGQFQSPHVASDGNDFLVAWRKYDNSTSPTQYSVLAQRVTAAGAPTGALITVRDASNFYKEGPAVAYGGGVYAVVWREASTYAAFSQLITATGALTGSMQQVSPNNASYLAVAWGSGFLITWAYGSTLYGRVLSSAGTLTTSPFAIASGSGIRYYPHSAYDGTNYLTTWYDTRNPPPSYADIYAQLTAPAGTLVGTPANQNIPISLRTAEQRYPQVAYCGGRYNVLFRDESYSTSTLFRQPIDTDGNLEGAQANQNILTYAGPGHVLYPAVACDGTHLLVVWTEQATSGQRLMGLLLAP